MILLRGRRPSFSMWSVFIFLFFSFFFLRRLYFFLQNDISFYADPDFLIVKMISRWLQLGFFATKWYLIHYMKFFSFDKWYLILPFLDRKIFFEKSLFQKDLSISTDQADLQLMISHPFYITFSFFKWYLILFWTRMFCSLISLSVNDFSFIYRLDSFTKCNIFSIRFWVKGFLLSVFFFFVS